MAIIWSPSATFRTVGTSLPMGWLVQCESLTTLFMYLCAFTETAQLVADYLLNIHHKSIAKELDNKHTNG
jgi:hypothetical protein